MSRLRYQGPSVYRTDSSLIRSPSGVERSSSPPPTVGTSVPPVPGAPRRVTPGLTLSVAMLPCLSFWPRPLECKVVPGIAGGTVAPAHSGETHSPELPHLSLSDLTTAPSALYRSQLMIRPIIPMLRSTGVTSISWHHQRSPKPTLPWAVKSTYRNHVYGSYPICFAYVR